MNPGRHILCLLAYNGFKTFFERKVSKEKAMSYPPIIYKLLGNGKIIRRTLLPEGYLFFYVKHSIRYHK